MNFYNINNNNKYLNESFTFIRENHPNKLNEFFENIILAEKETFATLIIAIIKERVLNFVSPFLILIPNSINLIQFTYKENNKIITNEISLKVKDVFSFNYFTFDHPVICRRNSINSQSESEVQILENCIDLVDLFKFNPFLKEIEEYKLEIIQSICNIALVNTLCKFSFPEKEEFKWKYLSDYVAYNLKLDPFFDKYLFYSKLHLISHHTHPTRKNRMGLSCIEMMKYSNEFGNEIKLPIIGIHRSVAIYKFIDDSVGPTEYFLTSFPTLKLPILNYLNCNNLKLEDYLIYPIHSFSASKLNTTDYAYDFKEKLIIIFPINISSFSTESFRSMVPKMNSVKEILPDLKMSVPVRLSGTYRVLTHRGFRIILISQLLSKILDIEPKFKDKFRIIKEFGSICHKDGIKECMKYNILAIVYKDNINNYILSEDEQPISSCFLFNESPIFKNKITIVKEIILQYHENQHLNKTLGQSIRSWYIKYINLLLDTTLILLTKYGISVEAHLQNSIFIYLKGEPIRLIIRDWLATYIKFDRLEKFKSKITGISFRDIPQYEGNYLDFYSLFMSSVLYSHIGQLNILISQEFKEEATITHNALWQITYEVMNSIFKEMKKDCDLNNIKEDEEVLFNSKISFKTSGIINRLTTDRNIWEVIKRQNPLVDFN